MDETAYKEYKKGYEQLLSADDVDRDALLTKINRFMNDFPNAVPPDLRPDATLGELSLVTIYRRTIQTLVDIVEDVAAAVTHSQYTDAASTRRTLVHVFLREDRRMYVGITIILLSIVLYFIDSAA